MNGHCRGPLDASSTDTSHDALNLDTPSEPLDGVDAFDAVDASDASDALDASDSLDASDASDAGDASDTTDAASCSLASECDDSIDCTADLCVDGVCVFAPELDGAVLFFDSDCPSGFTEVTEAQDMFARGHDSDGTLDETGGALTHTHALPSHTHTASTDGAHTHSVTLEGAPLQPYTGMIATVASGGHTHPVVEVGSAGDHTHTASSVSETTGPASNLVAFREAVFCRADPGTALIPEGAIAPFGGLCPEGWDEDVTFRDRMLRGHDDDSSYGETGGSDTHVHSLAHEHALEATDEHVAEHSLVFGAPTGLVAVTSPGGAEVGFASSTHTHGGSTLLAGSTTHDHTSGLADADPSSSTLPAWRESTFCRKDATAANQTALSLLSAVWIGETCPACWAEVTEARDRLMRGSNGSGPYSETGGSDEHAHSGDHGHDASDMSGAHDHPIAWVTDSPQIPSTLIGGSGGANAALYNHTHGADVADDGDHTHALMASVMNTDSVTAVPPYIEVVVCEPDVPDGG